jgi:hypothetical protein
LVDLGLLTKTLVLTAPAVKKQIVPACCRQAFSTSTELNLVYPSLHTALLQDVPSALIIFKTPKSIFVRVLYDNNLLRSFVHLCPKKRKPSKGVKPQRLTKEKLQLLLSVTLKKTN